MCLGIPDRLTIMSDSRGRYSDQFELRWTVRSTSLVDETLLRLKSVGICKYDLKLLLVIVKCTVFFEECSSALFRKGFQPVYGVCVLVYRKHYRQLPQRISHLTDCNFIMRMLFYDRYSYFHVLFYISHIVDN